jgi:hypothetical protein
LPLGLVSIPLGIDAGNACNARPYFFRWWAKSERILPAPKALSASFTAIETAKRRRERMAIVAEQRQISHGIVFRVAVDVFHFDRYPPSNRMPLIPTASRTTFADLLYEIPAHERMEVILYRIYPLLERDYSQPKLVALLALEGTIVFSRLFNDGAASV